MPTIPGLGDAVLLIETSALVELTTRRETLVVCCSIPEAAVMVRGNVPTGVFALVLTDSTEDFADVSVMLTEAGLKLAFAPAGKPVTLNDTRPVNPPDGVAVTS